MAVFKCKMCGGALEIGENQSIATCEFCGTQQTLPKIDDEKKLGLFNRANALRLKSEFDKAAGIYETIIAEFPEEAEAYWGLVLCKYGIEYVDEGKGTRVPTCHRTVPTSIMEDADFDMACSNADATAKTVYREEAKAIDGIQKKILEIAAAEEPYDVFICYKETDDVTGTRTEDSAIAQDIYTELSKEGYKVFFARVTLRNKAGCDFEPYIYSALSSAKVMLVLGTKFDYFDAVWVKNEWSRYLSMMAEDKSKHLIPCYKGLDAYDIPKEFKNLQALNIGDVTFIKNLFENIGNFVSKVTTNEVVVNTGSTQIEPLLKRAFMFLEDGDFARADDFCEQVLNIDPECAEAYLGKLMVEHCVKRVEQLKDVAEPFDDENNYHKCIRYGNAELKADLEGYIECIKDRNEKDRIEGIYRQAKSEMEKATAESLSEAIELFENIGDYKDSAKLIDECNEEKKKIAKERARIAEENRIRVAKKAKQRKKIIAIASCVVAVIIVFAIVLNTIIIPNSKYNKAVELMEQGLYQQAISAFEAMDGYKDSNIQINECKYRTALYLIEEEKYQEAKTIFEILGDYKDSSDKIGACNEALYNEAISFMEEGDYRQAISVFGSLDGYKDSQSYFTTILKDIAVKNTISAGYETTVGLKSDGTVVAVGNNDNGRCYVEDWTDIVAISAGDYHTVGLKSDGTVVAVGNNYDGQCDVEDWTNIVAISADSSHTVGLKSDGTVVAVGYNMYGQCDVEDWTDIVAISAGSSHTVGLKSDGTVVAVGFNGSGQCDVEDWTDIVAISAGGWHTIGLKSDGTVVAVGNNYYGQCDVSEWTNIVAISAGFNHTVGLKSDGTVVAVGENDYGQCDVEYWTDVVAISAGSSHTVGLKSNGTVVATEYIGNYYSGQCDVEEWHNIMLPD